MNSKSSSISTTLIVTTYNSVNVLELVLLSLLKLKIMPSEIIIADDGSTHETKDLVEKFATLFPIPLLHCWHQDEGFRLSKIRNRAIAMSSSDYIIMIDGDIVLNPFFIRDHSMHAKPNQFIQGSRVLVSQNATIQHIAEKNINFSWYSHGITNRLNACVCKYVSLCISKYYGKKDYRGVRGCNMSFWKKDLLKVNGFDEDFVGWGREDSEFVVRMLNNGIVRKNLKFAGAAFHLWHKENKHSETALAENQSILDLALKSKIMTCKNGLNQYVK